MFSLEEYVAPSRTGADGMLKLVSAIDMMQDCSQMWMKSEPVFEKYFKENDMAQLLASRQMDILRRPAYGEKLRITTSVFDIQGFQGFRNTVIYDEDDKPCIVSWTTGAFVCMTTNRLTKVPDEISAQMTLDPKVDMEYLERRIKVSDGEEISFDPVPVMANDIDMNKHMNNAHYVRIAMELLPRHFRVDRLRIEYKIPAAQGTMLYPYMIMQGDDCVFMQLLNEGRLPHVIMEFSSLL